MARKFNDYEDDFVEDRARGRKLNKHHRNERQNKTNNRWSDHRTNDNDNRYEEEDNRYYN